MAVDSVKMLFTKEQLERIKFGKNECTVDVHGYTANKAIWMIRTIIATDRGFDDFDIKVIHGYNHGTVIRDKVRSDGNFKRDCVIEPDIWNDGVTTLHFAKIA